MCNIYITKTYLFARTEVGGDSDYIVRPTCILISLWGGVHRLKSPYSQISLAWKDAFDRKS